MQECGRVLDSSAESIQLKDLAIFIIVTFLLIDVMHAVHTGETHKSLSKSQITDLFLKMREHANTTTTSSAEQIKELKSN